eukprot:gb/GECG01014138.1/.p1 GENE.gb/GECG01014138.1/~~gb/GECG01014138.1/.p1  ORF type:complete len:440 (+),score=48.96 gb/GECG01014138.1/:1-1320(+)
MPKRLTLEEQKRRTWSLFGATGFTGRRIAKDVAFLMANNQIPEDVVLCIAGRDEEKLENLKEWLLSEHDVPSRRIRMLVANVNDEESLKHMAQASFLVLDAVGPYRMYGEPVVKACVNNKCHFMDVSGEPEYMERIEQSYYAKAQEEALVIVSACAFDSVPGDLGTTKAIQLFREKFPKADLEKVKETITVHSGPAGFQGHFATFESAVYGFGSPNQLRELRKRQSRVPKKQITGKYEEGGTSFLGVQWNPTVQMWTLPFPGSDASVVKRTQRHNYEIDPSNNFNFSATFGIPTFGGVIKFLSYGLVFQLLATFSWGRSLLLKFPRLFTNGLFSHEGPSEEQMRGTSFTVLLQCFGIEKESEQQPNRERRLNFYFRGPEPGYVATPQIITSCARALHEQLDKIPERGVLTPSIAFRHTTAMQYMQERGMVHDVTTANLQ